MGIEIEFSENAQSVAMNAASFLASRPIEHNLIATLLELCSTNSGEGHFWIVRDSASIVGLVFHSPLDFHATITPMPTAAVMAAVEAITSQGIELPGVSGEASTAACFAGHWTERNGTGAIPKRGERLYALNELKRPNDVKGRLRLAVQDDKSFLVAWFNHFQNEVGYPDADFVAVVDRRVSSEQIYLWETDEPVVMAGISNAFHGVRRIGPVYTLPSFRKRGFGAALVGAVSEVIQNSLCAAMLYTDLGNPRSNSLYRRLGYEATTELLHYDFTR